jgi:hypothetical protein
VNPINLLVQQSRFGVQSAAFTERRTVTPRSRDGMIKALRVLKRLSQDGDPSPAGCVADHTDHTSFRAWPFVQHDPHAIDRDLGSIGDPT